MPILDKTDKVYVSEDGRTYVDLQDVRHANLNDDGGLLLALTQHAINVPAGDDVDAICAELGMGLVSLPGKKK